MQKQTELAPRFTDSARRTTEQVREISREADVSWEQGDRSEYTRRLGEVAIAAFQGLVTVSQQGFAHKPGVSQTGQDQLQVIQSTIENLSQQLTQSSK